jgi:hypothetical protein
VPAPMTTKRSVMESDSAPTHKRSSHE